VACGKKEGSGGGESAAAPALRAAGQALAKKLNVTPQAPANDQSEAQAKEEMDKLQSTPKGNDWDKAYREGVC
jgi:hypothetical protein